MSEEVWKHRFVAELGAIIKRKCGLGRNRSLEMALDKAAKYWQSFGQWPNPEAAAEAAFQALSADA